MSKKEEQLKNLHKDLKKAQSEEDIRAVFYSFMMIKDITSEDIANTLEGIPFPKEIEVLEEDEQIITRK